MSTNTNTPKAFLSTGTKILLGLIAIFGLVAVYRLHSGLGAATNLNDDIPWGLWVGIDILAGVALAAGGFTIAGAVHLFNMKKYKPLARPAVLTAFTGYVIVSIGVFFDIGKSHTLWHPLVMWQHKSIMFEVVWCVVLYTTVLALEFAPPLLEGLKMDGAAKAMRCKAVVYPLVIAAMTLSFLHQSSLGALFLLVPSKLSHLWWTTMLPYNFFLSAIAVGLAMVSFETIVAGRIFKHEYSQEMMRGLAMGTALALLAYLTLRFGDLAAKGNLALIFHSKESALFLLETVGGAVLPMIILFTMSSTKADPTGGILFAQILVIAGVILNRLNVLFLSQSGNGGTYFPSLMEFALTIGLISIILVLYRAAVMYLPIFSPPLESEK